MSTRSATSTRSGPATCGSRRTRTPAAAAPATATRAEPIFLGDTNIVVAVTVTGDVFWKATYVTQRLDVPEVQEFLAQYV